MGSRAEDPSLATCTGRFGSRWIGDDRPLVSLFACAVEINSFQIGTVDKRERRGMTHPSERGVNRPVIVSRVVLDRTVREWR